MLAWEPVMVTCLSVEPSTGLAILIWAPDIWRISLIFAPWRPMMQPMSWGRENEWVALRDNRGPEGEIVFRTHIVWNGQLVRAGLRRGVHPSWGGHRKHSECPADRHPTLEKHSESAEPPRQPTAPQTHNCSIAHISSSNTRLHNTGGIFTFKAPRLPWSRYDNIQTHKFRLSHDLHGGGKYVSTYPGSPGCYVLWGRGSAAWPAGEVWWAVEMWKERT